MIQYIETRIDTPTLSDSVICELLVVEELANMERQIFIRFLK